MGVLEVKVISTKLMRKAGTFLLCAAASAAFQIAMEPTASAGPILGTDGSTFAILGGAGVTIGGTESVITGSVGACCGATSVTGVIPTNFTMSDGTVQMGGATAAGAQSDLGTAITDLDGLGPVTSLATLNGATLLPGVYSIGATTLTGTLTLNGDGNSNALWVFLESSSLTTASSSDVNVINVGSGAGVGVYWVMDTSAVLGANSTFEGNILADTSISLGTGVTDSCGSLLTQTASVTLAGTDTVGIGCAGGGTITNGVFSPASPASVPEPGTGALLGAGIACMVAGRLRSARGDTPRRSQTRPWRPAGPAR